MNYISEEEYQRQRRKYARNNSLAIFFWMSCVVVSLLTAGYQLVVH